MNISLTVIDVRGKGVQVATPASTGESFWLPKAGVTWSAEPTPGAKVSATVPAWLAAKHQQLVKLRGQYAIPLNPMPGLDPDRATAKGSFPMSDYPQDAGKGALYRNTKAEKPSHPSHTGFCEIGGVRYRIAAWVKTSEKDGSKFFSLSFRDAGEQQTAKPQPTAGGPSFGGESIPFGPEVR